MKWFRRLSIKGKLILITLAASLVSVIVACTLFIVYDIDNFRSRHEGRPAEWWRKGSPSTARPPWSSSPSIPPATSWAPCAPTPTSRPR